VSPQLFGPKLDVALSIGNKHKRGAAVAAVEAELTKRFCVELPPAAVKAEMVRRRRRRVRIKS
jgi:hypothetical protein